MEMKAIVQEPHVELVFVYDLQLDLVTGGLAGQFATIF
jgi:hypothetical protein